MNRQKAQRPPLTKEQRWKITRRRFLIGTGSLGVLAVGGWFGIQEGRPVFMEMLERRGAGGPSGAPPKNPNVWFEMAPQGPIKFYAPKFEMGQGIHSALAQIAAEELEVGWDQLEVLQADSTRGFEPNLMFTFGSTSVSSLFKPVCEAAATMREMIRLEAAAQLGVPVAEVVAQKGACFARQDVKRKLTYGQIVAAKQGDWVIPTAPPELKSRQSFVSVGQNLPRTDVRQKLLGEPVYAYDTRVPGMLYGALAQAPRFGAKLKSANPGIAEGQSGVVRVVIDLPANFAGVVARTRSQARAALASLELEWEGGTTMSDAELETRVTARVGGGVVVRRRGNAPAALRSGTLVEASYRTPLAAHAHLEPLSATVHVQDTLVEAWVPTQLTSAEARALGPWRKDREVRIYPMQMGGSFGRKGAQTVTAAAARLSAATGQPVHVGWSREEEMQHSFYRPPTNTLLRGKLSQDGRIEAIEQVTASGDIIFSAIPMPDFVKDTIGVDFGVIAGLFYPYALPNYQVRSQRTALPIPTGAWRGVGLYPNVFALESFMDELAQAAGQDPLAFRLAHVPATPEGERTKRVLEDLRDRSDWSKPVPAGRARGVAFSIGSGTHVGMVVEVSVNERKITVERVTVTVDAGLVINPANAALQARGSVVMGISSTLLEKLTLENGAIKEGNFDDYPILTLKETPKRIDVHFIPSLDDPHGMGEPVIGPVGAAIANAVFALTGKRARSLPLEVES